MPIVPDDEKISHYIQLFALKARGRLEELLNFYYTQIEEIKADRTILH